MIVPDSNIVQTRPSALVLHENIEIINQKVSSSLGYCIYLNMFEKMRIILRTYSENIIFSDLLDTGSMEIVRMNSDFKHWNPFIFEYKIHKIASPIELSVSGPSIKINVSRKVTSVAICIYFKKESNQVYFDLEPRNLAHSAKLISEACILWEIGRPHLGSTYSIIFESNLEKFGVSKIVSSFFSTDLISQFSILESQIMENQLWKKLNVKTTSKIKETIEFYLVF